MIGRVIRLFHRKRRGERGGSALGWLLITAVAFALITVGSLVWIDNSVAIIPDNNPATFVQVNLTNIDGHDDDDAEFEVADYGQDDLQHSQMVVRGNGDRDDNREETYFLRRHVGLAVDPNYKKSASTYSERRTVAAYRDFGHLKVMPAGDYTIVLRFVSAFQEGRPCFVGGLLVL